MNHRHRTVAWAMCGASILAGAGLAPASHAQPVPATPECTTVADTQDCVIEDGEPAAPPVAPTTTVAPEPEPEPALEPPPPALETEPEPEPLNAIVPDAPPEELEAPSNEDPAAIQDPSPPEPVMPEPPAQEAVTTEAVEPAAPEPPAPELTEPPAPEQLVNETSQQVAPPEEAASDDPGPEESGSDESMDGDPTEAPTTTEEAAEEAASEDEATTEGETTEEATEDETTEVEPTEAGMLTITVPGDLVLAQQGEGAVRRGSLSVRVLDTRAGSPGWTAFASMAAFSGESTGAVLVPRAVRYKASDTECSVSTGRQVLGDAEVQVQVAEGPCSATWVADIEVVFPSAGVAADRYATAITHSVY